MGAPNEEPRRVQQPPQTQPEPGTLTLVVPGGRLELVGPADLEALRQVLAAAPVLLGSKAHPDSAG